VQSRTTDNGALEKDGLHHCFIMISGGQPLGQLEKISKKEIGKISL
jgi:hypothetical protein